VRTTRSPASALAAKLLVLAAPLWQMQLCLGPHLGRRRRDLLTLVLDTTHLLPSRLHLADVPDRRHHPLTPKVGTALDDAYDANAALSPRTLAATLICLHRRNPLHPHHPDAACTPVNSPLAACCATTTVSHKLTANLDGA